MELEEKYLVLKRADIEAALTDYELRIFQRMCASVGEYRAYHGKPENKYVVINQDEPYFPAVLNLMEEAEQASAKAEDTARRRSQGAKDGWEIRRAKEAQS